MGAEPLLDVSDHAFEQRQCRLGFTASNDVAAHVDPRAELDVADLVLSAQLGRLAVELQCALEITKLLMEPTQAVGDPADVEMVLSFAGLDETVVEHGARLGIKAAPDVSQTETPLPEPLVVLVVDSLGLSRHPALDLDGLAELAPPVVEVTEEPEAVQIQIGRTERLAETHGLLEHPGTLVQLAVRAMHAAPGGQSLGQNPVVPDLPGDGCGLFRAACRHRLVLPRQCVVVREREVSECLAL